MDVFCFHLFLTCSNLFLEICCISYALDLFFTFGNVAGSTSQSQAAAERAARIAAGEVSFTMSQLHLSKEPKSKILTKRNIN